MFSYYSVSFLSMIESCEICFDSFGNVRVELCQVLRHLIRDLLHLKLSGLSFSNRNQASRYYWSVCRRLLTNSILFVGTVND